MKLPHWFYKLLSLVTMPLRKNPAFFVFMYVLGCVCAWSTLSHARGAELYDNLYLELFLDVYVLTALLSLLPRVVMPCSRSSSLTMIFPSRHILRMKSRMEGETAS